MISNRSFIVNNEKKTYLMVFALVLLLPYSCEGSQPSAVKMFTYNIVETFQHDPDAFTQGLVYQDGYLYEGTGQYGESVLRKIDLESGAILQQYEMASKYFGEGITIVGDRIVQLTWRSKTGFIYRLDTFEQLGDFHYPSEGWGITFDGEYLIMSDGSPDLYYLDSDDFSFVSQLRVTYNGSSVPNINELEFINGHIYANIYQTDYIYRITPTTGKVNAIIDLTGLLGSGANLQNPWEAVLNGIAYDSENDRLLVTGKLWPKLFHIDLVEK